MGENTKIEWADHTFNPWVGCTKVSPACTNCYAEGWAKRTGQPELWRGYRRRTSAANWRKPLVWNRETPGARVFCSSLADVFEDHHALDPIRADLWELISQADKLIWLLLTKRPENIRRMVPPSWLEDWPSRVWTGATVEDQKHADERIPHLLRVPGPHFLSCEPLLGLVDILRTAGDPPNSGFAVTDGWGRFDGEGPPRIQWVIAGGESGPRARPSHPDWFRSLRQQSETAGVMFHFKQWGEWAPANGALTSIDPATLAGMDSDGVVRSGLVDIIMQRVGKAAAGRLLDSRTHDEVP